MSENSVCLSAAFHARRIQIGEVVRIVSRLSTASLIACLLLASIPTPALAEAASVLSQLPPSDASIVVTDPMADATGSSTDSVDGAVDDLDATEQDSATEGAVEDEGSLEPDAMGSDSQAADDSVSSDDPVQSDDAVPEASNGASSSGDSDGDLSTIEYVYVDSSIVSSDQEQHVAVGMNESVGQVESASMELIDSEGVLHEWKASKVADGTMLFSFDFSEISSEEAVGSYVLSKIRYRAEGADQDVMLDFSEDQRSENDYSFEVVTAEVADVLQSAPSDGGVTALTIDAESGELKAAESVDDAIQQADGEGVAESTDNATAPVLVPRSRAAVTTTREEYLTVAIDPGHGGADSGALGVTGTRESDINWGIAQSLKSELDTYTGVTAYIVKSQDETLDSLQARVDRAKSIGADVFISVHCNSAAAGAYGAEVYIPNSASYNGTTHTVGNELAQKILSELAELGLYNRGVKIRTITDNASYNYPTGENGDYYGVIRYARQYNIPGIIIEHAFVSNVGDEQILKTKQRELGVADATAIADQYNLGKDSVARSSASVSVTSHVANQGWQDTVYDNKVSGTTGKNLNLEAFRLSLLNSAALGSGITYRANTSGSWQDWKSNGADAGTTGKNTPVQAIQIKLTGTAAQRYDVYYRVHSAEFGWLGWAKNGESAGSTGYDRAVQALEVVLVQKGSSAPGSTVGAYVEKGNEPPSIQYRAHVRNIGWQGYTTSIAGTTGRALPVEALQVKVSGGSTSGGLSVQTHVENLGWMNAVGSDQVAGTTGRALQIEALRMNLTGELANKYDIYYRVHAANIGWMGWAKNGESAGTEGFCYGVEAVEIRLVNKGDAAPGSTANAFKTTYVKYRAHVADIGWQGYVSDGAQAGTTGQNRAMEALNVTLGSGVGSGGIQLRSHVRNIGWQGWKSGSTGTTGKALPMEAVQIKLTGDAANRYDIYYRVHSAEFGWLGWAKNGQSAGSEGYARSIQAIEIRLVSKGQMGPSSSVDAFKVNIDQPIMGSSRATAAEMVRLYEQNATYPSSVYSSKGASSIEEFIQIIVEEANAEGVRPDVVFAQAMHETGWLKFGGSVKPEQCNFAGLGAVSSTVGGATFADVRTGIRAQVQHLKAYATKDSLNQACVDPRFNLVSRGSATTICGLNGKWAVPGDNYGQSIISIINQAAAL